MNPYEMVLHLASEPMEFLLDLSIVWQIFGLIVLLGVVSSIIKGVIKTYAWIRDRAGEGRLTNYLLRLEWLDRTKTQNMLFLLPLLPLVIIAYAGVVVIAGLLEL
jgi:hypothetical protein